MLPYGAQALYFLTGCGLHGWLVDVSSEVDRLQPSSMGPESININIAQVVATILNTYVKVDLKYCT